MGRLKQNKIYLLFLEFSVTIFMQLTVAYENCGNYREKDRYCYDEWNTKAYCCGNSTSPRCCYEPQIWATWYFWIATFASIMLVGGCLRVCAASRTKPRQSQTRTATPRRNVTIQNEFELAQTRPDQPNATYSSQAYENSDCTVYDDLPPSYEQVQQQSFTSPASS